MSLDGSRIVRQTNISFVYYRRTSLNVKLLMAPLMDRPVYKIDILRSWFYIRDLSFFQYRKRISTAYRDSLVPPNEDICVLSFHISRFITFSFSKRVSYRYRVLFPRLFFPFPFFCLFSCLFSLSLSFFLSSNQIHVKFATQPRFKFAYEGLIEAISGSVVLFIATDPQERFQEIAISYERVNRPLCEF